MWGGRFGQPPDPLMWDYTVDRSDRRLLIYDLRGSRAHLDMLVARGVLGAELGARLREGIDRVDREAEAGAFVFLDSDEDVHSAVERRLRELVGAEAGALHTARSRNDQIALDLRLYMRDEVAAIVEGLVALVRVLADLADVQAETIVPAFTHLQQAQPISFGHQLLAHAWGLIRDRGRFLDLAKRIDESPLGAGAGGGSSVPIDPEVTAESLGFAATFANSVDAVASRDIACELAFCCARSMVGLSRLAEEIVLWSSAEFGWVTLSDTMSTGSSALPQKKNPDPAELARGRAASVIGDLTTLLTLEKGLPLSYARDLQEDKRALFHAVDTLRATAGILTEMLATAGFHPPSPRPETSALDLAEALIRRGVPFRTAHEAVGLLLSRLGAEGRSLDQALASDLEAAHPRFLPADLELIDPAASAARRSSPGGGSPASVREQIAELRNQL
jgi:argininosuccinate lyase